ncbi:hypothetical protein [Chitinimonas koreensis]|uniref:hypothetical protein n=1 Tax=Chitinimonas koreensis TaxID=356302 RepID=UPI00040ECABC|nr:hypothetical protein [Chitinimonas koreensis]QNM95636.1 hypothetical protein H9L41_17505 [Chitinimonas koreensis]
MQPATLATALFASVFIVVAGQHALSDAGLLSGMATLMRLHAAAAGRHSELEWPAALPAQAVDEARPMRALLIAPADEAATVDARRLGSTPAPRRAAHMI